MRIKARVWVEEEGVFICTGVPKADYWWDTGIEGGLRCYHNKRHDNGYLTCTVLPDDPELCTLRTDPHDVEIYEGDIIRAFSGDDFEQYVVHWDDSAAAFVVDGRFGDGNYNTVGWAMDCWEAEWDGWGVVGNIHQNQDILKVKTTKGNEK